MTSKNSEDFSQLSKKFVTQSDIDERNRKRQEEWEKVRKSEDPLEAPEVPFDNRTLYERLQEQKEKERLEKEEPLKFKNQIHRLDDEEIGFLDLVSQQQLALDAQRESEESRIIEEMRSSSTVVTSDVALPVSKTKPKLDTGNRKSQQTLLATVVKRKSSSDQKEELKKSKVDESCEADTSDNTNVHDIDQNSHSNTANGNTVIGTGNFGSALKVVGILPGIGGIYSDSSNEDSSDSSSGSDIDVNTMDALKAPQIVTQAQLEKLMNQQGE